MTPEDFKKRTQAYALRIVRLVEALPSTPTCRVISSQLLRCGTSVGSNYRSACRSRTRANFLSRMGLVEEECYESIYWMELLIHAKQVKPEALSSLLKEGNEILNMVVRSIQTARLRRQSAIRNPKSEISRTTQSASQGADHG
jgi:four helix bundle protein